MTSKEYLDAIKGMTVFCLTRFQEDCLKMAKENWTSTQFEMLQRLFHAVAQELPYNYGAEGGDDE